MHQEGKCIGALVHHRTCRRRVGALVHLVQTRSGALVHLCTIAPMHDRARTSPVPVGEVVEAPGGHPSAAAPSSNCAATYCHSEDGVHPYYVSGINAESYVLI